MILIPCFSMQQRDYHECNQYRMHPGWFWTDLLKGLRARRVAHRTSSLFCSKVSAACPSFVCRILKERKRKERKWKKGCWCWMDLLWCVNWLVVFRWYAYFAATRKVADYFVFICDLGLLLIHSYAYSKYSHNWKRGCDCE